jgi:hypothetical protein
MSFFNNINEFAQFVPIGIQLDPQFVKLPAQVSIAEKKYITDEIGKAFIEELKSAYNNETESSYQVNARTLLQNALAQFTIALFIPKHKVQIDSQGLRVTENDERKDAKPYDTAEAIKAYERDGWMALESLLEYLEENQGEFPIWNSSPQFTAFARSCIRTTNDLEIYTGIRFSRRLFKKIKPHITRHERNSIIPSISRDLFDQLITENADGEFSGRNEEIFPDVCYAVAHAAVRDALGVLPVEFSDEGVTVAGTTSNSNMVRARSAASENQLQATIKHCADLFSQHHGILINTLQSSPDDFPLFKESSAYREIYSAKKTENPEEGGPVFMM